MVSLCGCRGPLASSEPALDLGLRRDFSRKGNGLDRHFRATSARGQANSDGNRSFRENRGNCETNTQTASAGTKTTNPVPVWASETPPTAEASPS